MHSINNQPHLVLWVDFKEGIGGNASKVDTIGSLETIPSSTVKIRRLHFHVLGPSA